MDPAAAARYAMLAYQTEGRLNACAAASAALQTALQSVKSVQFFSDRDTDAQGYLLQEHSGDVLVAAIRGTNSLNDACFDIAAFQVTLPTRMQDDSRLKAKVHCGFVRQYNGLHPRMASAITKYLSETPAGKLVCTGHSSGAALACLLALQYSVDFPGRVVFRGFGSPLVGNAAFVAIVKKYVADHKLFKFGKDPVTKIPIGAGYVPLAPPVCYGPADATPKLPSFLDMQDHSIETYVQALQGDTLARPLNPWEALVAFSTGLAVKLLH